MLAQVGRHLDRGYIQVISRLRSTVLRTGPTQVAILPNSHCIQLDVHCEVKLGGARGGLTRRGSDLQRKGNVCARRARNCDIEPVDLGCADSPQGGGDSIMVLSEQPERNSAELERGQCIPRYFPSLFLSFPVSPRLRAGQHSVSSSAIDGCDGDGMRWARVRAYT